MRLLALDIGQKRIGIAVTDPLQLIANPLTTVAANDLQAYLQKYISTEPVEAFIVGKPLQSSGTPSQSMPYVEANVRMLQQTFPTIPIRFVDERYTSKLAERAIRDGGVKKHDRQTNKALIDQVAAAIILETYLQTQNTLQL